MIYTYENLFVAYFSINGRFCLVSLKNPTFSNIFPRAKHVLMPLNFERYVHVYLSFRSIFLICSCHLSNHPSICELFHIQVLMMVFYIYIYIYMEESSDFQSKEWVLFCVKKKAVKWLNWQHEHQKILLDKPGKMSKTTTKIWSHLKL